MTKKLTGKSLVKKILNGERDFSNIQLKEGSDLTRYIPKLNEYLREQNLHENPINIQGSSFIGIKAQGIYLPHTLGEWTDISKSDLSNAYLDSSNFEGANFLYSTLKEIIFSNVNLKKASLVNTKIWNAHFSNGTDIKQASFSGADLSGTNFYNSNFEEVFFYGADLERANLKNVKNLENTFGLGRAHFYNTIVSPKGKEIIEKALKKENPLIVKN